MECALSSDVVVAERSAQMGLPEILFNLFPGMGACSLLARRMGLRAAEELILSGRVLPATKLHEMGVVDVLRARQLVQPIRREELDGVAELWVDAALKLEDKDLRMMGRIVRSQMRRMEHGDVQDVTAEVRAEECAASA